MSEELRLLVVDDSAQVRQGLLALLPLAAARCGLAIEVAGEAEGGDEAVARERLLDPDVVVMDLEMPEGDGLAATRAMKARRPAVRVVALTVHGDPATRARAREAGVDAFVEKGASVAVLLRAIVAGLGAPSGQSGSWDTD